MAISYRSTLGRDDRVITLAVDRYGADGIEGVVYPGTSQQGYLFSGYQELIGTVEQFLQKNRYPTEVLRIRSYGKGRRSPSAASEPDDSRESERRSGALATYGLYISQRQRASWQGEVRNLEEDKAMPFKSFLELFEHLDTDLGRANPECGKEYETRKQRIIWHDLPMVLADPQIRPQISRIDSDVVACQLWQGEQCLTFLLRILFFEYGTCQGVLYWKEKRRQRSFRSFLELTQLIGAAAGEKENWSETAV